MNPFWRHVEEDDEQRPDERAAAAAIRAASDAVEHSRPDLAARLRELAAELERSDPDSEY